MSKYVVFQCPNCKIRHTQEIQKDIHKKDWPSYRLRCKSCNKTSMTKKTRVYKIFDHPNSAVNYLKSLKLGKAGKKPSIEFKTFNKKAP